jgi:hypothetical protein
MKRYSFRIIVAGIKEDILAICNLLGKDAEYFQKLRQLVTKYDQKYQVLAAWLLARDVEPIEYIQSIDRYVTLKKITKFSVGKNAVKINDEVFYDPEKLIYYIRIHFPVFALSSHDNSNAEQTNNLSNEEIPVIGNPDNSIRIYEITDAQDAINLVGNDTKWCIGEPGPQNMWQSYRDGAASTFFVIEDDNPPTPNQRKVAVDLTSNKILLTDIPNKTGFQLSNGWTWEEYKKYLAEKGVNLEAKRTNSQTNEEELILKNKPLSEDEKTQATAFNAISELSPEGLSVSDLVLWQSGKSVIKLPSEGFKFDPMTGKRLRDDKYETIENPDAKYYLSRYLGLGGKTKPEVFSYLLEKAGGEDLITKYLNTGFKIPDEEYEIIKTNKQLLTTYLRKQVIACIESSEGKNLPDNYFQDLISLKRQDLIINYLENVLIHGSQFQYEMVVQNPKFFKRQIELKFSKGYGLTKSQETLLAEIQDKEIIRKYIARNSVRYIQSEELKSLIANDAELFSLVPDDQKNNVINVSVPINESPNIPTPDNINNDEVIASIKKLIRIAQKLDHKSYYKLADKFTNILRRRNVQP